MPAAKGQAGVLCGSQGVARPVGEGCCAPVCGCPGSSATRPSCCCLPPSDPSYCGDSPLCECACVNDIGAILAPCCCTGECSGVACNPEPNVSCCNGDCEYYHPAGVRQYWSFTVTATATHCVRCPTSIPAFQWRISTAAQGTLSGSYDREVPGLSVCRQNLFPDAGFGGISLPGQGASWSTATCGLATQDAAWAPFWNGSGCSSISAGVEWTLVGTSLFYGGNLTAGSASGLASISLNNGFNGGAAGISGQACASNSDTSSPGASSALVIGGLHYGIAGSASRTRSVTGCPTNQCTTPAYTSGTAQGTITAYALPVMPCPGREIARGSQIFVRPMWTLPRSRALSSRNAAIALRDLSPGGMDAARDAIARGAIAGAQIIQPRGCSSCASQTQTVPLNDLEGL